MAFLHLFTADADYESRAAILAAVLSLLVASLVTWLYSFFFGRPLRLLKALKQQGIPGYPFRPFLGQISELIALRKKRDADPAYAAATHGSSQFFIDSTKRMGKVWSLALGPEVSVVVADVELARQVYVFHNDAFDKSPFIVRSVGILADGLVSSNGPSWAVQRRLINPAFSHKEIKRIFPTMLLCAQEAMAELEKTVSEDPGADVCMEKVFSGLTLDVICRSAFGSRLDSSLGPELIQSLATAFIEYTWSCQKVLTSLGLVPFAQYLPFKIVRMMRRSERTIRRIMRQIISERLQQFKQRKASSSSTSSESGEEQVDLLHIMMRSTEGMGTMNSGSMEEQERSTSLKRRSLSATQLRDNCTTFLFAGHDTTAVTLTWATVLLSQHPEWQEKARAEVDAVFAANGGAVPSFEQLSDLKLCSWILHETLRIYPPATALWRMSNREVKLSETLTIPKGCNVTLPILAIHYDKDVWGEDADTFRPSRFAEGQSKAATNPLAFMPFSLGPRACIGQAFALAESKLILALFLRTFTWTLSTKYTHFPEQVFIYRPEFGAPVKLTRRVV